MRQKLHWRTGRPLAVQLRERRHIHIECFQEKSKLAQHVYEEGHSVGWDEARILEIEISSRYRKHKESARVICLTDPISQPSLDISRPLPAMRSATYRVGL
jgi:hypothetical protein